MLKTLTLLLPALIPSWRFFDGIAPSPRIEVSVLASPEDTSDEWVECRPRPAHVSPAQMLARLFWSPRRNEDLFLVSLAERLAAHPTEHSTAELFSRLTAILLQDEQRTKTHPYMRFRLAFISCSAEDILQKDILHTSDIHHYAKEGAQ